MSKPDSRFADDSFISARGLKLNRKVWSIGDPTSLVFIAHGYCEHMGFYNRLASRLNKQACLVFSHDHEGHGKSGGTRAYIEDFQTYIDDVFDHCNYMKQEHKHLPLFIVGHSLGGMIAMLGAKQRLDYFRGVILLGPLVRLHSSLLPYRLTRGLLYILNYLRPYMAVPGSGFDAAKTSRDEAIQDEYASDPLVVRYCTVGSFVHFLRLTDELCSDLRSLVFPMLIFHGGLDELCDVEATRMLYDQSGATDKTIEIFPDARHQPHNELPDVRERVETLTTQWIAARTTS